MFEFLRRALLTLPFLVAGNAAAQSFPDRPVRLVVAFVPGGASGSFASTMCTMLSARSWSPAEMKILEPERM